MRTSKRTLAAAVATLSLLAVPAIATASPLHAAGFAGAVYGHDLGARHVERLAASKPHARGVRVDPIVAAPSSPSSPAAPRTPQYSEASDQQDCPTPGWDPTAFMQAHDATIYRLVVSPGDTDYPTCAQNVKAAGYRLYVSMQYFDGGTIADQVADTLAGTGPVWAFAIGNEQDLAANESAAGYLQDWADAEPTLKRLDPDALEVIADASPWAGGWLKTVMDAHPEGADVASFHCYNVAGAGLSRVPVVAAYAAADGYRLWCGEMAPAVSLQSPGWVFDQTVQAYEDDVQTVVDETPDLQMTSYYRWPQIGAN